MNLVRLIYVSRMTETCDMEGIQEILAVSRKKNAAAEITGILCYDPMYFLQCLEGPKTVVNALYNHILRDDRHVEVVLLEYADIEDRNFGRWTMAFLNSAEIDRETLAAFTKGNKFDPRKLSGARARDFLLTIAAQERTRLNSQR